MGERGGEEVGAGGWAAGAGPGRPRSREGRRSGCPGGLAARMARQAEEEARWRRRSGEVRKGEKERKEEKKAHGVKIYSAKPPITSAPHGKVLAPTKLAPCRVTLASVAMASRWGSIF